MEIKRIGDLFWKVSPNLFFVSILLGILTGVCYALLIPFVIFAVNRSRNAPLSLDIAEYNMFNSPTDSLAMTFLSVCVAIITIKTISQSLSMYVASRASSEHRLYLYRSIRKLALVALENIGQAKLINLLNIDIPNITSAAVALPLLWINIVTILGTVGYLVYIDFHIFMFVIGALVVAVMTYQLPVIIGTRFFARARNTYDEIQQGMHGLVFGAKELKLNGQKADAFYLHELQRPEREALNDGLKGAATFILAENYGGIISFLMIGVAIFHLPYMFEVTSEQLTGTVMALLFLTGPVGQVLVSLADVRKGKVSLVHLRTFYQMLSDEPLGECHTVERQWVYMSVRKLSYRYAGQNTSEGFALHEVDLNFRKGEVIFIVGGNGSGKSTLSKCLTLHYRPVSGAIYFGEQEIDYVHLADARQQISAIYTDFYLFTRLYGIDGVEQRAQIVEYLALLELSHKVTLDGDRFNTTDLSDGQRKRLALLVLLLEDREICLFDEWAADQDPHFKQIFYRQILVDLKLRGKLVIVISHDDRYFDCADQIVTMENGQVKSIEKIPAQAKQKEPEMTLADC